MYVSVLLAAVSVFYSCDKGGVSPEPVPDPDPPAQDDGGLTVRIMSTSILYTMAGMKWSPLRIIG